MENKYLIVVGPQKERMGTLVDSFHSLLNKCQQWFKIKDKNQINVFLQDNTEIDADYFEYIESGAVLYITTIKQSRVHVDMDNITKLANFLQACLENQPKLHEKVNELLLSPYSKEQVHQFVQLMSLVTKSGVSSSHRIDDLEWFKGIDTKFKTKEAVLRNSAETRMRSYLNQVKKMLNNIEATDVFISRYKEVLLFFKDQLTSNSYNAAYFDRSASLGSSLCDSSGLFACEGEYNKMQCHSSSHFINPYASREARIIFSTWNLDHVIEKSRAVIPALSTALHSDKVDHINLEYFYNLLFVHYNKKQHYFEGNLKLVHIACHIKKPHELFCLNEKIYISSTKIKPVENVPCTAEITCVNVSPIISDGKISKRRKLLL